DCYAPSFDASDDFTFRFRRRGPGAVQIGGALLTAKTLTFPAQVMAVFRVNIFPQKSQGLCQKESDVSLVEHLRSIGCKQRVEVVLSLPILITRWILRPKIKSAGAVLEALFGKFSTGSTVPTILTVPGLAATHSLPF